MARYITIIYTTLESPADLCSMELALNTISTISNWTIDLEDCDKVLRTVSDISIHQKLLEKLTLLGIKGVLMEEFENLQS